LGCSHFDAALVIFLFAPWCRVFFLGGDFRHEGPTVSCSWATKKKKPQRFEAHRRGVAVPIREEKKQ